MYLALFKREFLRPYLNYTTKTRKILSLLATLAWGIIFVVLEMTLYVALYRKLDSFSGFNGAFIVLADMIILLLVCLVLTPATERMFFRSEQDRLILGHRPVKRFDILFSKITYLYVRSLIYCGATFLALSLAYGILSGQNGSFYPLIILGWIFVSAAVGLLVLLFSILYSLVRTQVQREAIVVFLVTIGLAFLLCWAYSLLLDLFISLIRNSDLNQLFTTERIQLIIRISGYLAPVTNLVDIARLADPGKNFGIFIGIFLALTLVCFAGFTSYYFHYLGHPRKLLSKGRFRGYGKTCSPTRSLVNKEMVLALGKGDGVCSYVTLIAIQPLLIYMVLSSVNIIFTTDNLNYIFTLYPQIIATVDSLLFLLFVSVINTASSATLNAERNTLPLIKSFPITPRKQLLIKMLVPYILGSVSLLATCLCLWVFDVFTIGQTLLVLLAGLLAVLTLNLVYAFSDLKRRSPNGAINTLVSFIVPVLITAVAASLTILVKGSKDLNFSTTNAVLFSFVSIIYLIITIVVGTLFFLRIDKEFLRFQGGERT